MIDTREVDASKIIRESKYQVRRQIDRRTVKKYVGVLQAGNAMPAIQLAKVGDSLFLIDGWHRLAALEKIGRCDMVEAEITETTEREVYWLAAKANLKHGLPLKSSEVREVFRSYIGARKHRDGKRLKSYREISRDIGGLSSHMTIRRWMIADFPTIAEVMGSGEGSAEGGTRRKLDEEHWTVAAMRDMNNVLARFDGNPTDQQGRSSLVENLQEMLEGMQRNTGWRPADF